MRPDDGSATDDTPAQQGHQHGESRGHHEDPRTAEHPVDPNSRGRHAAPDDVGDRPLIDLSRDPHPGVPDHAAPDDTDAEPAG